MFNFLAICVLLTVLHLTATVAQKPFAQGNLAIVLKPESAIVSATKEIDAKFSEKGLWCQATIDGSTLLPIETAEFKRAHDPYVFEGEVDNANNRAYLTFNGSHMHDAGKYKCEIRTENDGLVWGNLFVYMRPVFHSEGSVKLEAGDADDKFSVVASAAKFNEGDTGMLHCPVYAYPQPDIEWYKDGQALESESGHYIQEKQYLYIKDITRSDEGLYRCKATNRFSSSSNDSAESYVGLFDQQVRVSDHWGWLLPLFVILVTLLLLFLVIYACAYCNRKKSDQYDVQKKEKTLRQTEEQKLREESDEE